MAIVTCATSGKFRTFFNERNMLMHEACLVYTAYWRYELTLLLSIVLKNYLEIMET